jgi:hypothetical protein
MGMNFNKFINRMDEKLNKEKNYLFIVGNEMIMNMVGFKTYEQAHDAILRQIKEHYPTSHMTVELVAVWDNKDCSVCYWTRK